MKKRKRPSFIPIAVNLVLVAVILTQLYTNQRSLALIVSLRESLEISTEINSLISKYCKPHVPTEARISIRY